MARRFTIHADTNPTIARPTSMLFAIPGSFDEDTTGLLDSVDSMVASIRVDPNGQGTIPPHLNGIKSLNIIKNQGKIVARDISFITMGTACGANMSTYDPDISGVGTEQFNNCVASTVDVIDKAFGDGYNSVNFDEYFSDRLPNLYMAFSDALRQGKLKYPNNYFFAWGVGEMRPDNDICTVKDSNQTCITARGTNHANREAMINIINNVDFYVIEAGGYVSDKWMGTSYGLEPVFEKNYPAINTAIPGVGKKLMLGIGASDMEDTNYNQDPNINFNAILDYEFSLIKGWIDEGKLYGVGIYDTAMTSRSTNIWLAKLIKHYIVDGKTETLLPDSARTLSYLKNGGFESAVSSESTVADWTLTPGNNGSVTRQSIETQDSNIINTNGSVFGSRPRVPQGNYGMRPPQYHILSLIRGDSANSVSQVANGLTVGQQYRLEVYSKKTNGDFGKSNIQTQINDASGSPVVVNYSKKTFYPLLNYYFYDTEYDITIDQCKMKKSSCDNQKHLWTKEIIEFTAPSEQVSVAINDNMAPIGERTILDFVQLKPTVSCTSDSECSSSSTNKCVTPKCTLGSCSAVVKDCQAGTICNPQTGRCGRPNYYSITLSPDKWDLRVVNFASSGDASVSQTINSDDVVFAYNADKTKYEKLSQGSLIDQALGEGYWYKNKTDSAVVTIDNATAKSPKKVTIKNRLSVIGNYTQKKKRLSDISFNINGEQMNILQATENNIVLAVFRYSAENYRYDNFYATKYTDFAKKNGGKVLTSNVADDINLDPGQAVWVIFSSKTKGDLESGKVNYSVK